MSYHPFGEVLYREPLTHFAYIFAYDNFLDEKGMEINRDEEISKKNLYSRLIWRLQEGILSSRLSHILFAFATEGSKLMTCYEISGHTGCVEKRNKKTDHYKKYKIRINLTENEFNKLKGYCEKAVLEKVKFNESAFCFNNVFPCYCCPCKYDGVTCAQFVAEGLIHIGFIEIKSYTTVESSGSTNPFYPYYCCLVGAKLKKKKKIIYCPKPYQISVEILWDLIHQQHENDGRVVSLSPKVDPNAYAEYDPVKKGL